MNRDSMYDSHLRFNVINELKALPLQRLKILGSNSSRLKDPCGQTRSFQTKLQAHSTSVMLPSPTAWPGCEGLQVTVWSSSRSGVCPERASDAGTSEECVLAGHSFPCSAAMFPVGLQRMFYYELNCTVTSDSRREGERALEFHFWTPFYTFMLKGVPLSLSVFFIGSFFRAVLRLSKLWRTTVTEFML